MRQHPVEGAFEPSGKDNKSRKTRRERSNGREGSCGGIDTGKLLGQTNRHTHTPHDAQSDLRSWGTRVTHLVVQRVITGLSSPWTQLLQDTGWGLGAFVLSGDPVGARDKLVG